MRITIEIPDEQHAELLQRARERSEKGLSRIAQQAIKEYLDSRKSAEGRTRAALAVLGTLSEASAARMKDTVHRLRASWRRSSRPRS